jgi:hypothetical protein
MQVDQGLLHGLKHLCLQSQHLLKSKQRGGGGLAALLFLALLFATLLFSVLTLKFLVLTI